MVGLLLAIPLVFTKTFLLLADGGFTIVMLFGFVYYYCIRLYGSSLGSV